MKSLPQNKGMNIIYIVAGLIFLNMFFNLSKLFSKFTTLFTKSDEDVEKVKNEMEEVMDQVPTPKTNLSYSKATYESMASDLFISMQGWGTDPDQIITVLNKLKTKNDALMLYKAFGVRINEDFSNQPGTLMNWFGWELSTLPIYIGGNAPTCQLAREKFKDISHITLPF